MTGLAMSGVPRGTTIDDGATQGDSDRRHFADRRTRYRSTRQGILLRYSCRIGVSYRRVVSNFNNDYNIT